MFKLLRFYFLKRMVKNPELTAQIYQMIYHNGPTPEVQVAEYKHKSNIEKGTIKGTTSKKQELIESLEVLKKKSTKTKQDKDSIGIIESVLKNI